MTRAAPTPAPVPEATEALVEAIPTPTLLIDRRARVLAASRSWQALLESGQVAAADQRRWLPGTDLLRALRDVGQHLPGYTEVAERLAGAIGGGEPVGAVEFAVPFPAGVRWFIVATSQLAGDQLLISMTDITERRAAETQLAHQAAHDVLTGLPNRSVLVDRLQQTRRRRRGTEPLETAVFFLDLDDFKAINDTHGHAVGDQVLREVARRLLSTVRADDLVARLGGDEFVVVARLHSEVEALTFADRLLAALSPVIVVDGQLVSASASVGVAMSSASDVGNEALLRNADIAMLKAKADRSGHVAFSNGVDTARRQQSDAAHALRVAIDEHAVQPWFQPVVDLADGSVIGAEALVRWVRADGTIVPPVHFVPLAERTGLIGPLDRSVWVASATALVTGPLQALTACSLNASPLQVASGVVVDDVREILELTGLAPERLTIEITETAVLGAPDAARRHLSELKEIGVQTALDDFGTGYSSLSHVVELPIDVVKLDRSFVGRMTTDHRAYEISRAVIGLGRSLGMRVVAEGVETTQQRDALVGLGCLHAQGYLYGQALPAREFAARHLPG